MANILSACAWRSKLKTELCDNEYIRISNLISRFEDTFGEGRSISIFSAPGRTEICGNHTDHQNGCVLAAAVNLDSVAAVSLNNSNIIKLKSEGYELCTVDLTELEPKPEEINTSNALVRGVAAAFCQTGCKVEGFDAYVVSDVLRGSGLSSSAAFEVLVGIIINSLFFGNKADPVKIAQIGQYAENVYFGKPSGLMDQMASSVGNLVYIDFDNQISPYVERINYDFKSSGYSICIIDSGADHADLTDEYAAITREMKLISEAFGKSVLSEVDETEFYSHLPKLRQSAGDRAVLRAIHYFNENKRVKRQVQALKSNRIEDFLALTKESGRSSWMYLQNVVAAGSKEQQAVAFTLALCDRLLGSDSAYRVHGGGFAGTVQAFVPDDKAVLFKCQIDNILGEDKCHILSVREYGGKQY